MSNALVSLGYLCIGNLIDFLTRRGKGQGKRSIVQTSLSLERSRLERNINLKRYNNVHSLNRAKRSSRVHLLAIAQFTHDQAEPQPLI